MGANDQRGSATATTAREAIGYLWCLIPVPAIAFAWWALSENPTKYGTKGMLWFAPLVYALTVPFVVLLARRYRKHRNTALQPSPSTRERFVHAAIVIVALPVPLAAFCWWIVTERHTQFGSVATALYYLAVTAVALCALLLLKRVADPHARG